jgi:hypothetical protein
VEGYSKLAAMKTELMESYRHVGVVSVGDYIQGSSLGAISKGEYIIDLMNLVGYDAVTLGNHEFDYKLPRLNELSSMMNTKPISCNFQRKGEDKSYFEPYSIASDSYHLLECGDGMSMFANAKILQNDGMLDVELLEKYITENLGGVIGEAYAEVKTNITFTEGEVIDTPNNNNQDAVINSPQTGDNSHFVLWVLLLSISATCIVVLEIYRRKKAVK